MYIIDDTYFQSPKRVIPNLDEADSKSFAELERIIEEKCRLLFTYFMTPEQIQEFESYLDDDYLFPEDTTGIPQKWIDLVNGTTYTLNDVSLVWNGLTYSKGTYKGSLLADYVYYYWLTENVSYMTGVGDAKANPKGANLVNPTQRIVTVWNEFVKQYQSDLYGNWHLRFPIYWGWDDRCARGGNEVSLFQFLSDHNEDYPNENRRFFEIKNQLGL